MNIGQESRKIRIVICDVSDIAYEVGKKIAKTGIYSVLLMHICMVRFKID